MKNVILFILTAIVVSSCSTLDKSRMLKTPTNYKFKAFADSINYKKPYKIAVDDEVAVQMYSNDGYSIISLTSGGGSGGGNGSGNRGGNRGGNGGGGGMSYKVRTDSTIKVPLIGRIKVAGLSLDEVERKIELKLVNQFNSPFVICRISNRRVYLFQGGYNSSIVQLQNENTTLFEILAGSGGIYQEGNASRIKLIRGDLKNPDIYLVDLSTIDGMKTANLNLMAGDIIYIDPFINYAARISSDVGSIFGFLSTILLVYSVTQR
jgi:polysaccharide export outer membrane protein